MRIICCLMVCFSISTFAEVKKSVKANNKVEMIEDTVDFNQSAIDRRRPKKYNKKKYKKIVISGIDLLVDKQVYESVNND